MKILLYNIGYATGLNGSWWSYATQWYRYLYTPTSIQQQVLNTISQRIQNEQIEVAGLIEVTPQHISTLKQRTGFYGTSAVKYSPNSRLRRIPGLKNKSNGFISNPNLAHTAHYITAGNKTLLLELALPNNISLFMFHFSLQANVRQQQLKEISSIIANRKRVIVCGDFNIFNGPSELDQFQDTTSLQLVRSSATFPAYQPQHQLDIFMVSEDVMVSDIKVYNDITASDHLPVVLDVRMS